MNIRVPYYELKQIIKFIIEISAARRGRKWHTGGKWHGEEKKEHGEEEKEHGGGEKKHHE